MPTPTTVSFDDTGHPGWDALRFVHRLLVIDEEWTQWHEDGFTWWGHGLAQRFRWEGPLDIEDLPTWFLSVETDFLRGVADRARALEFVDGWNANLVLGVGALVLEGECIRVRSRTYAMPESAEDRGRWLSSWGIVANAVASRLARVHEDDSSALAAQGFDPQWSADTSAHPERGPRDAPDEMLNVVGAVFIPQGQQPAPVSLDAGLDEAVHIVLGSGAEAVGGEFDRALLASWPTSCGRLTWRVERAHPHPTLGYGVRGRLTVVLDGAHGTASRELAHRLNELEATVARPLMGGGAWAVAENEGPHALVYTTFFPNAGLQGRLAPLLTGGARFRGEWLAEALRAV